MKGNEYRTPNLTVDTLVFAIDEVNNGNVRKLNEKKLQVLLVQRDAPPFENQWSLPGVFVSVNETLEEAAMRCLQEKGKVEKVYVEQLYAFDGCTRDPRGRIISMAHMALVDKKKVSFTEVPHKAAWFTVVAETQGAIQHESQLETDGLSPLLKLSLYDEQNHKLNQKLGFDHEAIILYGLNRLRNKLAYTDIGFSMLGSTFTLAELQQVYEVILGKKLVKANFQRKMKDKVKAVDAYKTGGYRPAQLYSYAISG